MAAAKKPKSKKQTKESGAVYVSSAGTYYEDPEITAEKINDFQDNVYGRGLAMKQRHLIFTDKYTLDVLDTEGETDPDITADILKMCDSKGVRLWPNMQRAYNSIFWYGIGLYNPVWEYVDNIYTLTKLRHLPSYSFRSEPMGASETYSELLKGITLDDKGEIEFHQVTDSMGTVEKLENIFYVKDPVSDELAGESIVLPLIPVFNMLKFVWNTQMQQSNRTGAKILFIKVTDPQKASELNTNVSDVAYANEIIQNWGKNTAYQLRGNMELIDPGIKDDSNNLDVIEALHNMVIDYITPASYITSGAENRLGGSDKQREELILKYIQGVHTWLEDQFEMLLNRYLEYNGYEGYVVKINIPSPSVDISQIQLEQANSGFTTKSLTINEIRERLGAEVLDDEGIEDLLAQHERIGPAPMGFGMKEDTRDTKPPKEEKDTEKDLKSAAEQLADDVVKALEKEKSISNTSTNKNTDVYKLSSAEYEEANKIYGKDRAFSIGKDKVGYYIYTHRARSESRTTMAEIPTRTIKFIASTS